MTDPPQTCSHVCVTNAAYHETVAMPHSKIKAHTSRSSRRRATSRAGVSKTPASAEPGGDSKYGPTRERAIAGLRRVQACLRVREEGQPSASWRTWRGHYFDVQRLMTDKEAKKNGGAAKSSLTSGNREISACRVLPTADLGPQGRRSHHDGKDVSRGRRANSGTVPPSITVTRKTAR